MSFTVMPTTSPLALKLWAKKSWLQIQQRTVLGHMMNRGTVNFIDEFIGRAAKGDQMTYAYIGKLTGLPIGEGGTVDGNEQALDLGSFQMSMNVIRDAVLNPNDEDTIESQRTLINFENEARRLLTNRFAEYLETSVFYQLAGANPNTLTINGTTYSTAAQKLLVQGNNAIVAPSTNRILRAGGAANDQSLISTNKMTLDLIDYALESIDSSDQGIEMLDGQTYDLYVSPEQLVDLMQDTTGAIQWKQIEYAKLQSDSRDSYILSRFKNNIITAGVYRNVNIFSSPRVAYGVNSSTGAVITTVRRAVLVGQGAMSFASPMGGRVTDEGVPIKFKTMLKDYEYYKGVAAVFVGGLKKNGASDREDIGTFVISTYAARHS